jgi:hypothetical protein
MDKIKINIHLTINEENVKTICKTNQCSREQLINNIIDCLETDMASTIEDNEMFWTEKIFEIE